MSFSLPPINTRNTSTNLITPNSTSLLDTIKRIEAKKNANDKHLQSRKQYQLESKSDIKQKELGELKRIKELEELKTKEIEEKLKRIEAERTRRKELLEEKKKKEYNIDQLKDRKKMKQRRIQMDVEARDLERKIADTQIKRKIRKLKKEAEKEAVKMNAFNEKIRMREEALMRSRRFSQELADRPVLISSRFNNSKYLSYNHLNFYKLITK